MEKRPTGAQERLGGGGKLRRKEERLPFASCNNDMRWMFSAEEQLAPELEHWQQGRGRSHWHMVGRLEEGEPLREDTARRDPRTRQGCRRVRVAGARLCSAHSSRKVVADPEAEAVAGRGAREVADTLAAGPGSRSHSAATASTEPAVLGSCDR